MTIDQRTLARLAKELDEAELERRAIAQVTDEHPRMALAEAYSVQAELRRRKEARGAKTVGLKVDLTSWSKLKLSNNDTPVFGFLSDYMCRAEGTELDTSELLAPRVEAEICVVTKAALRGPNCHIGTVLAAIDFVVPAAEVVDSRYRDTNCDLQSLVADNTCASRFVIGGRMRDAATLDLRTLGIVLEKNGEIVATAAGAAVLGNPLAAVAKLVNHLGQWGEEVPAGTLVMTGGVSESIPVQAGDSMLLRFQHLGSVSLRFS